MIQLLMLSRYSTVSVLCVLLHNAIMIGFDRAGFHYFAAIVFSFCVTLLVAYSLHCRWTFQRRHSVTGFARYALAMSVNLPLSAALITLLFWFVGLPMLIASPIATIIQIVVNYGAAAWALRVRHQ